MHSTVSRLLATLLVGATTSALTTPALAQRPTIGVMGGVTFPTADFADFYDTGYNLGAFVGFRPAVSPVGFRIEGSYSRFDYKRLSGIHNGILSGTGNIIVSRGDGVPGTVRPYLIGGVGVYNSKVSGGAASVSDTKFGVNGGLGIDLPLTGIGVFVEARYHYVFTKDDDLPTSTNTGFVPITVGVRF